MEVAQVQRELIERHGPFLVVAFVISMVAACSSDHPDDVQSRIAAVENSLIAAVINTGSEPEGMALSDRMQHYQVPGVSIAVINNGEIEWARGYGVTEAGGSQAISADTVFQACSVSKPVSVTGIMLLAQSGAIDISRDVNDYLSSWRLADNSFTTTEKATIRRLMSHTGGTNVSGFGGYPAGSAIPTLLQVLNGAPPANSDPVQVEFVPGSESRYSGGGMEVLQQMTEDMTGMPFRTYMKDNLLGKLGMNASDFVQPMNGPLSGRAAKGHDADGAALPGGWNTYPELIAAGLWTTPSDLARLIVEVQKAASGNEGVLLSQQTAIEMLTKQPNSSFGLGYGLMSGHGGLIFQHSGSNFGYKSFIAGYKDRGQGVAVMTNGENGMSLFMEVLRSVARVYGWPDFKPEERSLFDVPPSALLSYTGEYKQSDGDMTFQVYVSGNGLMMKITSKGATGMSERFDVYPTSLDTFLLGSQQFQGSMTFSRDGSGSVAGLTIALKAGGTIVATRT
jgi:CubicO group peptidase (beta-lactamase class C family)